MNAAEPSVPVSAVIDPADIQLPPTQPIDITEVMREQLRRDLSR